MVSDKKVEEFYVYQPYAINQNNGYLWAVGIPYSRFKEGIETHIKGLSRDEAKKIADVLNEHRFLTQEIK